MDKAQHTHELLWNSFRTQHAITEEQLEKFKRYAAMLIAWNEKFNLTAITHLPDIVSYHFQDSLALAKLPEFQTCRSFADVGTGGGFPGIPLKIIYPDKTLYLIEVNQKKITFLREVIDALQLDNVTIIDQDWRTFLRHSAYDIELFCARASLAPEELVRLFAASSAYRHATLVYWASQQWEPADEVKDYIREDISYRVGDKQRRLVVMKI